MFGLVSYFQIELPQGPVDKKRLFAETLIELLFIVVPNEITLQHLSDVCRAYGDHLDLALRSGGNRE